MYDVTPRGVPEKKQIDVFISIQINNIFNAAQSIFIKSWMPESKQIKPLGRNQKQRKKKINLFEERGVSKPRAPTTAVKKLLAAATLATCWATFCLERGKSLLDTERIRYDK